VLSFGSGPLVLAAMRRELPDHPRTFRLPFGDVIPFIAFYASNLIVYWAGWTVDWKLFVTVLIGFVLLVFFQLTGKGTAPRLDWRAGATWVIPWLAGLALISYFGDYPEQKADAGNTGDITFGWGFLALLGLSIIVYALALSVRLPRGRMQANIQETAAEAEAEAEELGAAAEY
jgi:amino acid transporter